MGESISLSERQLEIIKILNINQVLLTTELLAKLNEINPKRLSQITLTRDLKPLVDEGYIERKGKGRAVRYQLSIRGALLGPMDIDAYFVDDPDQRQIYKRFNFDLFEQIRKTSIFSDSEMDFLNQLNREFHNQKIELSPTLIKKEFERVTIELSWKSSAIEGNTYSLLETETLLKEGIEAKGKKSEEAKMLLNHKAALEFLREHATEFFPLSLPYIEKVHSILISGLGVSKNLRKTLVGITGTDYRPLDNQFQIREAIEKSCQVINSKKDCFTRAILAILLISYIQPFEDGNKRSGRIIGNALLLADEAFPLSFRSVDETEYKKAILLFYERNNMAAFKKIFIEQSEFAVKNYFRSKN